jgi:hypothetical protein
MTGNTAMPWVKLRTDYLDDVRFSRLDNSAKARFFELLMLAGKLDAGGFFTEQGHELTDDEIAWKLRSNLDSLVVDMSILEAATLLHRNGQGWCICAFEDEQGPTQADKRAAWKDRQKKHRESHAIVTSDKPVTGSNVTPTEEEEEEEEEEEKRRGRGEEEESAGLAQTSDAGPASAPSTSPAAPTAFSEEQTNPQTAQAALPNPADPALVSSRENKGSKPVGLSGYTKLPETPAQAMDDPIIRIFSEVTGRIPGVAQYKTVIETILYIRKNIAGSGKLLSVVDYLKPYWLAWSGRKSQTGKPYNPSNITWLTEWAINASIPPIGGEKPADNLPRPPSVEETKKRLEQEAQTTYTPPSQEVLAQLKSLSAAMTKKR